jgi:hypothetical protein
MPNPKNPMHVKELEIVLNEMGLGHIKSEILQSLNEAEAGGFDHASTTPDPQTAPLGAAFPTGNDLLSHGGNERHKVNGGGNPYAMSAESLIPRLSSLYQEVKSR